MVAERCYTLEAARRAFRAGFWLEPMHDAVRHNGVSPSTQARFPQWSSEAPQREHLGICAVVERAEYRGHVGEAVAGGFTTDTSRSALLAEAEAEGSARSLGLDIQHPRS